MIDGNTGPWADAERAVVDAPTAEQLSGELRAVHGPTDRSVARERRMQRRQRRRHRRNALLVALVLVLAAIGGVVWWSLDDSTDVEPQVSGVSVVNTTSTIPAEPTTAP